MQTQDSNNGSSTTATTGGKRYAQLQALVASFQADFEKFYGQNNKAAGTRVRGHMQALKTLAQEIRTEVQTMKNETEKA